MILIVPVSVELGLCQISKFQILQLLVNDHFFDKCHHREICNLKPLNLVWRYHLRSYKYSLDIKCDLSKLVSSWNIGKSWSLANQFWIFNKLITFSMCVMGSGIYYSDHLMRKNKKNAAYSCCLFKITKQRKYR